ncbi:hypothetical protein AJ80_03731 [Polytolypa hystricis UAMH7299]|uniref:Major facilitator superfamily (MFS) profile domain-containing protein n=1 Tax=Polytolypa hystricis (strain UAMH7299) TaxID=1447883 RepID=A0A2B7YGC2_POLH7|nr:hypothetical protein AJ80_03731 [Polytolypa hystricis UAMH7299]
MGFTENPAAMASDFSLPIPPSTSHSERSLFEMTRHGYQEEDIHVETPVSVEDGPYMDKFPLAMLTLALCLCAFLGSLDTVILATATPKITATFQSLEDIGWYGSSYLLTQTALQPTFGKLYQHFNTKVAFLCGLLAFEIGSVLCAASTSSAMLIAGRAVSGAGAAAIFSGILNIIGLAMPLERRPPYIAILSSMLGISNVVGPPLGGVITDRLGWRWCFWINIPCGAVIFIFVLVFMRTKMHTPSGLTISKRLLALDPVGSTLLLAIITAFLLAVDWTGKQYSWSDGRVWGSMLTSGILLIAFSVLQWRLGDNATLPPRLLLKQRTLLSSSLYSSLLAMGFFIHTYYLPIYFQAVKGSSAIESGVNITPYQVSNTIASIAVGFSISYVGWYVPFVWVGLVLFTVGSGLLFTLNLDSNTAALIGYQMLAGFGLGSSVQVPYIAAQVVTGKSDMSAANALMIFSHAIGGTLGMAIGQNIFMNTLRSVLSIDAPDIDPATIINAGPTGIRDIALPYQLKGVLSAYNTSLMRAFILPIATGGVGFLCSLLMEWKSVKKAKPVSNA